MALISQPGSDYQITSISLDAGYTRDLILMLIDVHAVLDHLYLDGTQPQITAPAEDYLHESASPYTLPALIDAPRRGHRPAQPRRTPGPRRHPARHASLRSSRPRSSKRHLLTRQSPHARGGAKSEENSGAPHTTKWGQIKEEQWGQIRLTKPPGPGG
jgi:hypothetical protein